MFLKLGGQLLSKKIGRVPQRAGAPSGTAQVDRGPDILEVGTVDPPDRLRSGWRCEKRVAALAPLDGSVVRVLACSPAVGPSANL